MTEFDKELDVSGLNCPLPILRVKQALTTLDNGQVLKVIVTDPGSTKEFKVFSEQTTHLLLESDVQHGKFTFLIKKN